MRTRIAAGDDAARIAALLIAFNTEFGDPTPPAAWLRDRIRTLIDSGETEIVLVEPADVEGLAVLRFRPSLWSDAEECYLAELYVRPEQRGRGLGRALLDAAIVRATERGADYMDLTTTNTDTAAVALYESAGFDRHERRGPDVESHYFELDLPRAEVHAG